MIDVLLTNDGLDTKIPKHDHNAPVFSGLII